MCIRDRGRGRGEDQVVEADHADVGGHPHTAGAQPAERAEGHQVVVGHDRGDLRGQGEVGALDAAVEAGWERTELGHADVLALGRGQQTGPAFLVRPGAAGAAQVGDALVAQRGQVVHHLAHAAGAVHQHGGDLRDVPVHQHHRGEFGEVAQLLVGHGRRAHHQPVDLLGHGADQALLGGRVLLAVGEQHRVGVLPGPGLHPLEDAGVEGVAQIGHHDAEDPGLAGDQAAGGGVGPVPQLVGGGDHPIPGLLPDQVGRAQGAGHRRNRHVRLVCDVADRDRQRSSPPPSGTPIMQTIAATVNSDPGPNGGARRGARGWTDSRWWPLVATAWLR